MNAWLLTALLWLSPQVTFDGCNTCTCLPTGKIEEGCRGWTCTNVFCVAEPYDVADGIPIDAEWDMWDRLFKGDWPKVLEKGMSHETGCLEHAEQAIERLGCGKLLVGEYPRGRGTHAVALIVLPKEAWVIDNGAIANGLRIWPAKDLKRHMEFANGVLEEALKDTSCLKGFAE